MGDPNNDLITPLHKTITALSEIRSALLPFLHQLPKKRDRPDGVSNHRRAEAEAAVALTIGTLRYMGGRLRGVDELGKGSLRGELERMRELLVSIQSMEVKVDGLGEDVEEERETGTKRRRVLDTCASERMIRAALNNVE